VRPKREDGDTEHENSVDIGRGKKRPPISNGFSGSRSALISEKSLRKHSAQTEIMLYKHENHSDRATFG